MHKIVIKISLILALIGSWAFEVIAQSSEWNFKNRVQFGFEWDDNVYESRAAPKEKPSARLLFQTRGEQRKQNLYFGFRYSGGYQGYQPIVKEDKLINELTFQSEIKLTNWLCGGINAWGRLKLFLYKPIDYYLISSNFYTRINLSHRWYFTIYIKPHRLNYRSETFFDYQGIEASASITKYFSRKFSIESGALFNRIDYKRQSYFFIDKFNVLNLEKSKQRDKLQTIYFDIRYTSTLLWSLSYFYEINDSNSYGFSYFSRWLLITLSRKLPYHLLFRMQTMIQKKNYQDPLAPYIPLELDTETEDSNYLIIDVSRSFAQRYSVFLRLAWYQNESPFRAQYYQKQIATVGLEYQF